MLHHEVSLTRGQYWLLEAAVTTWIPLSVLNDEEWCGNFLNRRPHGMSEEVLVSTFASMLHGGLVEVAKRGGPALRLSADDVRALIKCKRPNADYGLTSKGGALWEAFAFPRWAAYVTDEGTVEVDESGRRLALLQALSEGTILRFKSDLDRYLIIKGRQPAEIVSQRVVSPWQATYWKQFDRGQEVGLKFTPIGDDELDDKLVCLTYFDNWYTMKI